MSPRPRPELPDEADARNGAPSNRSAVPRSVSAEAIRSAIDALVSKDIPDDVLLEEAAVIAAAAARMEAAGNPGRRIRTAPDTTKHPQDFFPNGPTAGWDNPLALPIQIWGVDGDEGAFPEIRGRAIFTLAYEGPPTCVHGGVIALVFDELLGDANLIADSPGMTGTLTITYRAPTPLLTPLDLEARLERIEGRKIFTSGAIKVDGKVTAEAQGIFINVAPEQMLDLAAKNAAGASGDVVDPEMMKAMKAAAEERAGN